MTVKRMDVLKAIKGHGGLLNRTAYIARRVYQDGYMTQSYAKVARAVRRDLNRMFVAGIVERSPDNGDGLGYQWDLTDSGRAWLNDL